MENNNSMNRVERSRREKVTRYSVRKVSFGAASVAVAAFFMFLGNGAVYAAEPNVTATDSALAANPSNDHLDEKSGISDLTALKNQEKTITSTPTDASSTSVESSTVSKVQADATTSKPADATPAPVVSSTTTTSATEETEEKATPALDKKQLEDYVAEIDAKLVSGSYATKTDESVATLKEHLGLAKLALTTAKSQDELTKAYRRLFTTVNSGLRSKPKAQVENPKLDTTEGKETVGKKASNTEKATGTNSIANSGKHDPRNGKSLDANNPFRTGDAATTDEDNDSSVNEKDLDIVNPYFEANGTPTTAEKWKVINAFDLIGWKPINPNQQKVVIANGKVTQYGGYSSVVNPTHPYSIPLALYKTAGDRTSKSDKFDGVYQDIDVKPGQEVVITQNTNSFGPIGTRDNRTILTVSYPERGNDVQGKIVWRSLGTPYNGVVTVPKGVTKLRVRLEADPDSNVAHTNNGKIEIDGETYYLGTMVSNLSITTGAHVVANTPTVKYNEVSPSATATTVRATISVEMENKGHASSGSNKYQVKLPEGATFVSSEGGTAPGSVNDGTLTINYKGLKPGEKVTLSYVVDLPADKPTSSDFKGTNTFLTSTTYGGLSGTIQGGSTFAVVGAKLRNIPVTTQNVTVSMYKTDLENKVNELETQLAQLNQADYTPESWKAMQDQLAEAKNILNEEKNNVPVADRKNQSEINTKLVLLEKEKAKLDLEKAAKDQIAAIEAVDGSVKEEKEAAKAKVIEALAAAKKAVDSATTEADVATKLTEETNKITPILPAEEVKTAAKNDIQSVLEEKKTQIAARDDLTTEEKEAAVKEAERLAQDAKNRVDAATTEESVERNKDRGEEKVEKVDPAAKVKPAAKAAIDAALKAQEQAIDAKPDSTKEEKEAAKEEARAKAEAAKTAIDAATSNADVTAAKEAGVGTITPVEPKAEVKPAAKQAIEDAYTAKVAEIEKRPDLTTEEKEAAKAEARKLADAAKANVDKAKTDAGVAVVEQQGTTNVADVDPVAKAKPAAKAAIDAALKAQEQAIDAKPDSTKEEKEAAKEEARAKAEEAKKAIDAATSNADVTAAKETGVGTITPVEPKAEVKPAAKQAIEDAYTAKVAEIEARPELTTEEKSAAKAEARKLADAAKANVDKAKTDDAVATAEDKGTAKVENVNPVAKAKPAAKAAIDAALKAQEKAIDAKPESTIEEKAAAKEEARAKAEEAKAAIDAADSNADVTAAKEAGVGTITPVEPKAEVKPAAKQAIEDAYTAKVAEIEKRPELTTEEKSAAKAEARKLADAAKANVDKAKTDDAVAAAEDKGTTKVADVDPAAKAKPAAKAAVDAALAEKDKAIDANDKLSDAEKSAAKEEAKKAADEAKKAIDAATDQAGVDAKATEGTDAVAAVNPVGKDKAKAAVDAALAEKDKAIDANDKLSDAEKSAAKEEAKKAADEAKKAIDAATDQAGVDAKATEGTDAVAAVNPVGKDKAKAAVDAALAEKEAAIDANDKLSDAEKSAAKEEAKKAADEAKKAIDAATDQAGVDAKATEGTDAVAAVNPVGKDKAKAAVDAALAEKDKAIDANDKLSDAEKSAAKEEAKKAADEAKKAIDAATDQAGVDAKATEGTDAVAAVNPVGKDKAKAAVDAALAEKEAAIDANDKLSDAEKAAAKEEAKKAADEAKKAIDAATDQAGVDAKATEGTDAVAAVNPVGKDKAKAAVDAALAEKDKAIDANDKLSDAEKSAAKEEAKKAADEAKKAIDAATDQAGVDAKATEGTDAVAAVNPVGKDKAKAAVDAALAEKEAAIDANDKLSDAEKAAAKEEAKKAADEAKKAIDAATDQAGVDAKATEGTDAVAAVNPVGKDKAKAAVDAALAEKDKAIDANDKLSDAEKSAAKEEAKKAADEAKKAIDAATDQAGVDAKATEGTDAVAAVNPVGKDKAKAAVDAALAEKEAAIDANDKLSDAEKSAAKEEAKKAADEAKKAIDAATDQAGVDAKATEGTDAVAAVNPVGKDKAKAAVDAALAEKEAAIDANDKLSDAEKSAAKEEAKKAADEAKKAIDAATDQAGVDAKATEGTDAVAAVNPVGKDKAKAAVDAALAEKDKAIDANDKLSDAEKSAAKEEAKKAADEAKKAIDAATDQAGVDAKATEGTDAVAAVNPVGKDKAKAAVDAALAEKEAAIDANDKLSDAEKSAAKEEAKKAADEAKKAIDAATDQAGVDAKATEGTDAVAAVNPVGKDKAKAAVDAALAEKEAAIDANDKLSDAEKAAAKEEAKKAADEAKKAIDAATDQAGVDAKATEGTDAVAAVNPVGKDKAKAAVDAALAEKDKAIDANDKLSDAEKSAAKEEAKKAADEAKKAIDAATDQAGVDAKATEGTDAVAAVNPVGKDKAKAAVDAALAEKDKAIDANDKLSDAEKSAAKEEAKKAADEAKKAIDAATDQAGVDAKATEGTDAVAAVNPVGKDKAKAAVDAALAEKEAAIDANDKLSDAEKAAAKEEAKKAADEAKKAIDAATDQAGVDAKATEGTDAVAAVNPVGKDKAKAAVDAALAEKDKAIDANDKLSDAEKSAAKEEAKKAADEAKKAIDAATDQAGVDAKATEGTDAVAAVNPVGKDKAKAAVDAALAEKEAAIDANDKLSDAEKSAAKEEAKKAADEAKKAIDAATDQAGVDAKATEGTDAVAAVNPVGKDKAKAAVDAALAEKEAAIDANDKLSDAEKSAAKEEAKKAADEAKKAIDAATDQAGVDAKATEGTDAVAAVNPVGKDKAKAAVDAALAEKDKAIDANDKLSDAEKSAAKEEAKKAADEAKKAIDAATDQAGVDAKATEGTDAVAAVNPVGKDKAKAAVDAALAEKEAAIDANDKLSDAEKSAAKEEAKKAADEAKKAIDAATDQAGVDAKATEGTDAVAAVNPVGKDKAKAAVDAALAEKEAAIDANDKLSDAEKAAAKEEAKKAADEAKKAIDAATDQAGVDAKATEGTDAVAAVNPVGKDKAKAAVDAALAEKDKAIDANDKLSDAEKSAAKEEAKKAADEAKKAIDAATDQAGVDAKATEGTDAVAAVNPVGKDKAKAAVDAALAEKEAAIDANDKLSDAEKSAAKEEAKKAADEAKKAIDAATDQAGVDAKATEGTDAVAAVNPVGKDKAKAAVDAALAEKDKAIDANDKLSDAEKSAAKEEAKKAADEAKKAIDAATDQAGVDAKATEGTDAVAAVNPVGKDKAKAAVDAALAEKEAAIDANDKLSDAEKSAAKEEAKKAADEAKKAIDAATDQAGVDAKATEGTDAVAAVNPVGKDKAKAAVDAALAEKEAAIDANDKLSDAEKAAAKEEAKKAADEAKKAIDAATDQAGVDAKATEGTDAVAAVNPVGKDKAKAAVDAALAEKDKAIDANDKLSDAEKEAAKEEAKKAADEAKKAIDAATDQAGVDAKATEGKAEIAKVTPAPAVEVGKSAAKAEIEKAAKAKEAAIDANDKLSDAEKAAAKAQVAAEAKKAIEAIEKATTEADVEAAKEAGKAEIAKVAPATTDYKAKAKAEVEAELAKKLAELENATDLTEAEKAAAKAQVVNKAKEAIEAIQKAATEADVDQAIRNFVYRISAVIREQEEYDLSKLFVNGSVTVKQGESLTDKDVLSKLNLPSGVEIVKVEKPTTSALGTVMAKVTVKLADGSVEEINVPVEVIVSQNHGNEGNVANNGANNTEAKVNKAKLEGAIHQLDELIIKESAKLDAETAKEANALSADAKKVFANADATQAEVDAMVKRIEDFMAKVAPSTDHATTANDQSAQTPAVAPATTQAASNASQKASAQANARKVAKELPNTGTADSTVAMVAAAASALLGLGLAGRRRKEDEEA